MYKPFKISNISKNNPFMLLKEKGVLLLPYQLVYYDLGCTSQMFQIFHEKPPLTRYQEQKRTLLVDKIGIYHLVKTTYKFGELTCTWTWLSKFMFSSSIMEVDAIKVLALLLKFSSHMLIWWIGSYNSILLEETNCEEEASMLCELIDAAIQCYTYTDAAVKN